jgi:hypothetical protein
VSARPRRRLAAPQARLALTALGGVVVLGLAAAAYLTTPRTSGVQGDWAAKSLAGQVIASRALVSGDNTAIDLTTGRTVRLGSVPGGTPYVGDDRLVIAGDARVDSVRLDATARWTWRAPAGTTVSPVAADHGSTAVDVCAAAGPCDLVGLTAQGRQAWRAAGIGRRDPAGGARSLPRVAVTRVDGGGVMLTDPVSGRRTLRPGDALLATDAGTIVLADVQQGSCVVAAYVSPDPLWTRVLPQCPDGKVPGMAAANGGLALSWAGHVERLDLATGRDTAAPQPRDGQLAAAGPLVAVRSEHTTPLDPLRWGKRTTVVRVLDAATGETRAQIASTDRLDLLRLEPRAVVVREGSRVVRYTLR